MRKYKNISSASNDDVDNIADKVLFCATPCYEALTNY